MEWKTILVFIGETLICGMIFVSGVTSAIEVTRADSGDIFTNPNPSCSPESCRSFQGHDMFGVHLTKCKCACSGDKKTYAYVARYQHQICVDRKYLERSLVQAECIYRLGTSCHSPNMPVIDTSVSDHKIISNCVSSKDKSIDGQLQCQINVKESYYLDKGIWFKIWKHPFNQNIFSVELSNHGSIHLKWKKGFDTSFRGRIISLGLQCRLLTLKGTTQRAPNNTTAQVGSLSAIRPCLMFKTKGTIAVAEANTTDPFRTTERPKATDTSVNATAVALNTTVNPKTVAGESKPSSAMVVTTAVASLLGLALALGIGLVLLYRRKKRNHEDEGDAIANPNYEKGPDPSLKLKYSGVQVKAEQSSSLTKQPSIYQPLVQNTRPRCLTAPTLCQIKDPSSIGSGTLVDAGEYATLNKHTMDKYGLDSRPISRAVTNSNKGSDYHDYQEIDDVVYAKPGSYSLSRRRHSTYDNVPRTLEHNTRYSVVAYAVAEPRMYLKSPLEHADRDDSVFRQESPRKPASLDEIDYCELLPDVQSPTYWVLSPGLKSPAFVFEKDEIAI